MSVQIGSSGQSRMTSYGTPNQMSLVSFIHRCLLPKEMSRGTKSCIWTVTNIFRNTLTCETVTVRKCSDLYHIWNIKRFTQVCCCIFISHVVTHNFKIITIVGYNSCHISTVTTRSVPQHQYQYRKTLFFWLFHF